MRKFLIILLSFIIITILALIIIFQTNKILILNYLKFESPKSILVLTKFINNPSLNIQRNLNDYNVKFLPETQFIKLDLKKVNLKLTKDQTGYFVGQKGKHFTFYLTSNENYVFAIDSVMNLYYSPIENVKNLKNNFKILKFNEFDNTYSRDIKVFKDDLYISSSFRSKEDCYNYKIFKTSLQNFPKLNFKTIFSSVECNKSAYSGGRIGILETDKKRNILLTTYDGAQRDYLAQDDKSIFGKILIIDENNGNYEIFSKGHRNSIGLYIDNKKNIILNTENGPRGGDEINLISRNQNYGWAISSYGDNYDNKNSNNPELKFDHENFGFKEPIFSFLNSIGISQIIKLENDFSNFWNDNFLIGSLNSKHLYRVKFDKSFNKMIFFEKIFIGERIRDLEYISGEKMILLALEETGSIGVLRKK